MSASRTLLVAPPLAIVALLGVLPLALVVVWSFWTWDPSTYWIKPELSLAGYGAILDVGRWTVILSTLAKAFAAAIICTILAYPLAYSTHVMAGPRMQILLMALMTIPFFTSYLIRSFAWRLVLGRTGAVNEALQSLNITSAPLDWLLFSNFAVMVGFIASYLPFAVFPLLLSMRRVPPELMAAARDLGAGFWRAFFTILAPLTYPGLFAGFLFVFVMVVGSSTEVQMLGGAGASIVSVMINDVMRVANYPLAFAISVVMLVTIFGMVLVGNALFRLSALFGEDAE